MSKLRQLVKMQKGTLTYLDSGVAKKLFSLPRTATLLAITTQVVTLFDDTGTDFIRVGTVADDNYFVSDFDVHNAGYQLNTLLQGGPFDAMNLTGPVVDIYATYTGQNDDSAAGEAIIIATYADPFTNPA